MEYLTDLLPSPPQVIPGPLQQTCLYFARKKIPVSNNNTLLKDVLFIFHGSHNLLQKNCGIWESLVGLPKLML